MFSDSHGRIDHVMDIIKQYPKAEAVFHCGDICGEEERLRNATPHPVCIVRGNCDYSRELKECIITRFAGKKIALCHGHRYLMAGGSVDALRYWGMEQEADIVLFGHTHVPFVEQTSSLTLLNPGSISRPRQADYIPTYAVLEIEENGEIKIDIKKVQ